MLACTDPALHVKLHVWSWSIVQSLLYSHNTWHCVLTAGSSKCKMVIMKNDAVAPRYLDVSLRWKCIWHWASPPRQEWEVPVWQFRHEIFHLLLLGEKTDRATRWASNAGRWNSMFQKTQSRVVSCVCFSSWIHGFRCTQNLGTSWIDFRTK